MNGKQANLHQQRIVKRRRKIRQVAVQFEDGSVIAINMENAPVGSMQNWKDLWRRFFK